MGVITSPHGSLVNHMEFDYEKTQGLGPAGSPRAEVSPYSFTFILFSYFFLLFRFFSNSVSLFLLVQTLISVFSSYFYPPG